MLKRIGKHAGVAGWQNLSSHSMRTGFATAAGRAGVGLAEMMAHAGWKDPRTALGYIQTTQSFVDNPINKLEGLFS